MFQNHLNQQNIADQLKRLVEIPTTAPKENQVRPYESLKDQRAKRTAYQRIQEFEGGMWHTRAFEDAFKAHPAFNYVGGQIEHVGDGSMRDDVTALLTDYLDRLPKPKSRNSRTDPDDLATYTTKQAAEYLGVNEGVIYWHATRKRTLNGELIGGGKVMMFSKNELDRYRPLLGRHGRPRKTPENEGSR